jgi:hypothetical protein
VRHVVAAGRGAAVLSAVIRLDVMLVCRARLARLGLRALGFALLLAFAGALSGCARVAPYERGWLARRNMQLGGGDLAFGEEHAQAYREGSIGGGSVKGGGCGCN